ncbi:MAG: glycosyltransferase [Gemmatimonadetes bacterium]|nr:glycosyltransferase [Gemmatimonadota bacterium]
MNRHESVPESAASPAPVADTAPASVVIPVYNKERYLVETIDSVLAQTLPPEEIVVIDDGSTDRSAEIAASYGSQVHLIRQSNSGESVARNEGIEASTGEWIALLDGDDVWEPEKLERQFQALEAAEFDPVFVYSDVYLFDDSGQHIGEHVKPEYHAADDWRVQMLCDWSINPSTTLIRRSALDGLRFPPEIRHSEDMIFFLELRAKGPFLKVHEKLAGYRRNEVNQTASKRHHLDSVISRWQWYSDNESHYGESERYEVRRSLAQQLLPTFGRARYTTRDMDLAKECRRMYREIHPDPGNEPRSMKAPIHPAWIYRVLDRLRSGTEDS